ncbi:MAG: bifunctional folylpolyglutamate synthase/dihydrofolate synthase [Tannerellaceae bacterium]|jgi:dihydrofolate synthase/folylpolyglutamate synthase|nr:bifunctional folylpolyglutamate synthase/dihydrofolate synthase [Tannerellaceae bacterium]
MTYEKTLEYLFAQVPAYHLSGVSAYKPGLEVSIALDNYFGNPHQAYRTIHVAGTNGKGSVCHSLAAVLQKAGYRVGLYTSPHLNDFRERIRVNGKMMKKDYVVDFIARHRSFFEPLHPSFFELTTAMAFEYFRHEKVDFAVIEVGLGGRLDSTNIITPMLSVITNIGLDHTEFLGDTLGEIAFEKAGIIKEGVPVVIGEADEEVVENVFRKCAEDRKAPILFAQKEWLRLPGAAAMPGKDTYYQTEDFGLVCYGLSGKVQEKNLLTILCALRVLNKQLPEPLPKEAVKDGLQYVTSLTGLRGRWEKLWLAPLTIADTGHNTDAWRYLGQRLNDMGYTRDLSIVLGFSSDKDVDSILRMAPAHARYFFTQAESQRAMPAEEVAKRALSAGLRGLAYPVVENALFDAIFHTGPDGFVFVGGSHFVVAEAMLLFDRMLNK